MKFKTISEVYNFLNAIPKFSDTGIAATNYSLVNIRGALEELKNPHDSFSSVHVAGTNGKGTVCGMLEKVYSDAGYKTGLYTSPHLIRYNERFKINGKEVRDEVLISFFNDYYALIQNWKLSYFEISTLFAFWYFKVEEVDLAIIETGLGGRLDATNVIQPELTIITSISLDHTDVLGNTVEAIAKEKAGIIKTGIPVVVGDLSENAMGVIKPIAEKKNAKIIFSKKLSPQWDGGTITFHSLGKVFKSTLKEKVNIWNYAMTYCAIETLRDEYPVEWEQVKASFEEFKGAKARFEQLVSDKKWYFSGAHNKEALISTIDTIKELGGPKEIVLIAAHLKDKELDDWFRHWSAFKAVYYYEMNSNRALRYENIPHKHSIRKIDDSNFYSILNELKDELVIFAGSFYFYPTVRQWIQNL